MKPKEKAAEFINRFETILRVTENCEEAIPLTHVEINFYNAIELVAAAIQNTNLVFKKTKAKDMDYR